MLVLGDEGAALAGDIKSAGLACVHVAATPVEGGFGDPDGSVATSLGGARLAVVRPDRTIAMTSEKRDPAALYAYARDVLGVEPRSL